MLCVLFCPFCAYIEQLLCTFDMCIVCIIAHLKSIGGQLKSIGGLVAIEKHWLSSGNV